LLLIEEPEAHLHTQRQLRVMRSLQGQAQEQGIQIIVTTHSPNLASAIELDNMVMIRKGRAFSLAEGQTELEKSDYRFLERFLDVTKANLFFACGVMIVEGDAENILLPTLATLIGRDFTEHGVSIVNVGSVGLRRYARIFQRKDAQNDGQLDIPSRLRDRHGRYARLRTHDNWMR
jgi:putative ATP-dependent endonuclease of OLD family